MHKSFSRQYLDPVEKMIDTKNHVIFSKSLSKSTVLPGSSLHPTRFLMAPDPFSDHKENSYLVTPTHFPECSPLLPSLAYCIRLRFQDLSIHNALCCCCSSISWPSLYLAHSSGKLEPYIKHSTLSLGWENHRTKNKIILPKSMTQVKDIFKYAPS